MNAPTIELKKFHYAAFASEDSSCYDAEVWVNGKRAFTAHNSGTGGPDDYRPIYIRTEPSTSPVKSGEGTYDHASKEAAMKILEEYAASLPAEKVDWGNGTFFDHQPDVESLIGDALAAKLVEKEVNKAMKCITNKTKLTFVDGEKVHFLFYKPLRSMTDAEMERGIAKIKAQHPNSNVLNDRPESVARAILSKLI
jgi:hypothetical protein